MNKKITLSGDDWTDKADDYFKILGMGIDATNKIVDLKNKIDNGGNNNNTNFQDKANQIAINNDDKRVIIKKKDDNTLLIVGGCIAGAAVIGLGIWAVTK